MSIKQCFTRYSFIGFALYIVATVIASVLLMSFWVATGPNAGMSQESLAELAANNHFIQFASQIIGITVTLAVAMFVTKLDKNANYRSAIGLAVCLTVYGILSVVLHPEHEFYRQVLKVVLPVTLSFLGARLVLTRKQKVATTVG